MEEFTSFNVKPTVGFTLSWAGVTPAPSESGRRWRTSKRGYLIGLIVDSSAIEVIIWLSPTTLFTRITRALSWSGSNLVPTRGLAAKNRSTNSKL